MLKDIKAYLVKKDFDAKHFYDNQSSNGSQEICKWPTETRYVRYDQFLNFVATVCQFQRPYFSSLEKIGKSQYVLCVLEITQFLTSPLSSHRDMLACVTVIEVHYLMLLLDYLSKTYKSHDQNEDGAKRYEFKCILDNAFDIYLRCDPVSLSLIVRRTIYLTTSL